MEFKGNSDLRQNCRKFLQKLWSRDISEDDVDWLLKQLKQSCDYVTGQEVKKSIDGLELKFKIHANHKKSEHFSQLVSKLIQLTNPTGLTHPTWSMLYLLIKTAFRPTDNFDSSKVLNLEHYENSILLNPSDNVNTNHNLNDDNLRLSCVNDSSSTWSDTEEENQSEICLVTETKECSHVKVQDTIPLYKPQKQRFNSQLNLNEVVQNNICVLSDGSSQTITEYHFIQQLMWALQLKQTTSLRLVSLFSQHRNLPRELNYVSFFDFEHFTELIKGLSFIHSSSFNEIVNAGYCLTYQAYVTGLRDVVSHFYQELSTFEKRITERKSTINISHFMIFIKPWEEKIATLAEIQELVMKEYQFSDNNTRVELLLSVLTEYARNAQVESYKTIYPMLLRLLSSCLEPFLNMVEVWLNRGQLFDPYEEFRVKRNSSISPEDERFWNDSVITIASKSSIANFLHPIMSDVSLGGRSVELLRHLSKSSTSNFLLNFHSSSLVETFYNAFNDRFQIRAPISSELEPSSTPVVYSSVCGVRQPTNLLKEAFKNINVTKCQNKGRKSTAKLITPNEFYPLLPLLEHSLLDPIRSRQRFVCKALINILYEKCSFRMHILNLRRIHFMQAGDIMGRFCLQLFHKLNDGDKWDNEPSLNLSLLNCLFPRMSRASDYVSVSVRNDSNKTPDNFSRLQINYLVPWPINLVITQESLVFYNRVLSFLLQIKQSIITLQRLSFKELKIVEEKNTRTFGIDNKSTSSLNRCHRLHLLRAWLLHFVSSVDNYVMECVMEPSHSKFDSQLQTAIHLGQIIDGHQEYIRRVHKQCLQEPSGAFLLEPILEVFSIVTELASAWVNGINSTKLGQLEENYVRRHQFIAAVLGTDASHSMLPYVETLAAALIHSCPASHHA